jgi:hypothetical protein
MIHLASRDPYHRWPRIKVLAERAGVAPISEDAWPALGAYDEDGKFYDVEAVISALKAKAS